MYKANLYQPYHSGQCWWQDSFLGKNSFSYKCTKIYQTSHYEIQLSTKTARAWVLTEKQMLNVNISNLLQVEEWCERFTGKTPRSVLDYAIGVEGNTGRRLFSCWQEGDQEETGWVHAAVSFKSPKRHQNNGRHWRVQPQGASQSLCKIQAQINGHWPFLNRIQVDNCKPTPCANQ